MKHLILTLKYALLIIAGLACSCIPNSVTQAPAPLPFNFHILDDGRAYRSAQPTADELANAIDSFGIRTVINLRGENPGQTWYDDEIAVCADKGVTSLSFRMSAQHLPPPDVLEAAIKALQTAEYPILIHCEGGADRTGAVCTIYRILIKGEDKSVAMSELSPQFFHFRQLAPCMDTLIENYEPTPEWLLQYEQTWDQIVCTP